MEKSGARQEVVCGEALEVARYMKDACLDAIIEDVPYGLGNREPTAEEIVAYIRGAALDTGGDFMGKKWFVPPVAHWRECLRVLKPGAHCLVFGGTRTFDLIALGLRTAGFEFRDTISDEGTCRWMYGSGFPKGHNLMRLFVIPEIEKQLIAQGVDQVIVWK